MAETLQAWLGMLVALVMMAVLWLTLSRTSGRSRRRYEKFLQEASRQPGQLAEIAAVQRRLTALRLLVNTARYGLLVVSLLLLLNQLHVKLDSLVLPAGFFGAALGLGGQNLVRDFVAGFFIVFEGQFAVGDAVTINGVTGSVEEVGLRVTRLRDPAGQLHFFPNGAILQVARLPRSAIRCQFRLMPENPQQVAPALAALQQTLQQAEQLFGPLAVPPLPVPPGTTGVALEADLLPVQIPRWRDYVVNQARWNLAAAGIGLLPGSSVEVISSPAPAEALP